VLRHEDGADAEALGDGAGVLRASAAEGEQRMIGGIVAFTAGSKRPRSKFTSVMVSGPPLP